MEKETNCPYKKLCMSVYPEQRMNEHRLNCSKDNSYLTSFALQLQYCDDFVAVHFAIFHKAQGTV